MASESSSTARHVQDFLSVLKPLTGLSAYSLHGYELVQSYLDELKAELEPREYPKLLEDAADYVKGQLAGYVPASVLLRRLVPNQDVVPLTKAAERLLPVTGTAVAMGQDLGAVTAQLALLTGLGTHTISQTRLAQRTLLIHRADRTKARAILAKVREKFREIQEKAVSASLADDPRRPTGAEYRASKDDLLTARGHVGSASKLALRQWSELSAFMGAASVLRGGLPGDMRGIGLADRYLTEVRRDLPKAKAEDLIRLFAEKFEKFEEVEKQGGSALVEFVENSRSGPFGPIIAGCETMALDVATFLAMSILLTGLSRIELIETAQTEAYLAQTIRAVGYRLTQKMLERARSVMQVGVDNPSLMEVNVRLRLLGDQKLGPIARATMKMWYLGQWEPLPAWWYAQYCPGQPGPTDTIIVSASAYKAGLAWGLAGAHPSGAHQPGYGSWALPPGTDAVV